MFKTISPIMTIGSCLSANVAIQLSMINPYMCRISSVQHNRIDQFTTVYIEKKFSPLSMQDINFKLLPQYSHVNLLDNQIKKVGLGKALPNVLDKLPLIDPIEAMNSGKIKLCLVDDYAEIFFKIFYHREKNTPFFLNKHYIDGHTDDFIFQNELLNPELALESYTKFCQTLIEKNHGIIIVFIPFPVNLKKSESVNKRAIEFEKIYSQLAKNIPNCYVLNRKRISLSDLKKQTDIYHFHDKKYFSYAEEVLYLLNQKKI